MTYVGELGRRAHFIAVLMSGTHRIPRRCRCRCPVNSCHCWRRLSDMTPHRASTLRGVSRYSSTGVAIAQLGTPGATDSIRIVSLFLPARRYAGVGTMTLCLSDYLSQVGVLSKRLYESSWFWHGSFLPPRLRCVKRKFGYLQK